MTQDITVVSQRERKRSFNDIEMWKMFAYVITFFSLLYSIIVFLREENDSVYLFSFALLALLVFLSMCPFWLISAERLVFLMGVIAFLNIAIAHVYFPLDSRVAIVGDDTTLSGVVFRSPLDARPAGIIHTSYGGNSFMARVQARDGVCVEVGGPWNLHIPKRENSILKIYAFSENDARKVQGMFEKTIKTAVQKYIESKSSKELDVAILNKAIQRYFKTAPLGLNIQTVFLLTMC